MAAAVALAIGAALLVGKGAGYAHVLHSLRAAQPQWLAVALPAEVLAYVGYTLALQRSAQLGGGPSIGALIAARLALTSLAATRLIVAGGPGLLYWGLRRAHLSKRGALARLTVLNVLLYGVFAGAAGVAALAVVLTEHRDAGRAMALAWLLGVAAAVIALLLAAGLAVFSAVARRIVKRAGGFLAGRKRASSAFAGTGLFWSGDITCLWAGLRAFDVRIGVAPLIVAYASSYLLTMLPLLFGGVGAPEAALALAVHAFGPALAPALLGVLAYRMLNFWLPTIPGLALLTTLPQLGEHLERTAGPAP